LTKSGWFLCGIVAALAIEYVAGVYFIQAAHGFSTGAEPSVVERWIARRIRMAAMPAAAKSRVNQLPDTAESLAEARGHWADHCASCHANDGSGDTLMGKHTWPPAPDMRASETQNMTDGQLFYVIENGVRLTAMPAWAGEGQAAHDEADSWKLVHFIRHLPQLTFEEKKQMEKLNPKGPEDRKEEEEEKKFLRGEDSHDQPIEHHHH
jgi:mono/diheme cytochrome c family protein